MNNMPTYNVILIELIHRNSSKELLLVKRNRDPGYDLWSLPGGVGALKHEPDPKLAVQREVQGELGAEYVRYSLFSVKFGNQPDPTLRFYFVGELAGEPFVNCPVTTKELAWFSIDEIENMSLAFEDQDKEVIREFAKQFV